MGAAYIVRKRARFVSINGPVNLPYGTPVDAVDGFLVHKGRYAAYDKASFCKWNPVPWITWAISIALVYMIPFGLPSLNGIILGAVLYTALMAISKQRVTTNLAEEA